MLNWLRRTTLARVYGDLRDFESTATSKEMAEFADELRGLSPCLARGGILLVSSEDARRLAADCFSRAKDRVRTGRGRRMALQAGGALLAYLATHKGSHAEQAEFIISLICRDTDGADAE